ncbi:MAG: GIY-YIG nuclease family protein [Chlorobi bacterium]|nr:GIY-YIG nuclease family protein [Chlorobiota bacterium]
MNPITKKYYTYVIKSKEGLHYTGMTENLENRLKQHNNRALSFWTKRGTNWRLIYFEEFDNKTDALIKEKWLKSGVGREFLKKNVVDY